jgi:hypothetical protein
MTLLRHASVILLCGLVVLGLPGCDEDTTSGPGATGSPTPAVCEDLDALSSSVDDLQALELGEGALDGLRDELAQIRSELDGLSSDTSDEYADETAAVRRSVDALGSSLDAAAEAPSATAWATVADDLREVGSAVGDLGDAVGDTC